ncbi:glycoside hydrolase family 5 protein [Echinimonas agarilytica]|uniref:Glycoside hydrolase family 5 protein n=1 Tax=Echinimonas agarilytica TaxID=1215918 RepID=A0AA41W7B3_9GAMM|nr:cellulase family glycosylhydrolase [Echinimonas agarilytica]MCM2680475.1 glycoside hydrolase family 5 protein [Echinimonas agarilytica]
MRFFRALAILAVASVALTSGCSQSDSNSTSGSDLTPSYIANQFRVERGVNVSHWLSQSDVRGEQRDQYMQAEDFKLISELGFDHVRLPVDEEQLWNEHGERQQQAFDLMHQGIQWSLEQGLNVIVDLHVLRAHHFNRPDSQKIWTDAKAQQQYIQFWQQLSEELKQYPLDRVAYEPLNEAVADDNEDWNKLINWVISEVRQLEPNRTIIMGSNRWQQVETFEALQVPQNDPNIMLSFHYYTPFNLTHYRSPWTANKDYTGPVSYPGQTVSNEDLAAQPAELAAHLTGNNGTFDREVMAKHIEQAVRVAQKHGLKLYCGEFGAFPTTDLSMRQEWYRDLMSIFNQYDIAWAHWNYKNDFPLVSEQLEPDDSLLDILLEK